MKLGKKLVGAVLVTVMATSSAAEPAPPEPDAAPKEKHRTLQELYGGVVTNQTVTVAGQDFYQYFVASWRDREMSERYAIAVHERPSARWGSQVWIEYAQKRVFQASLPTSRAAIKALSEQAVDMAYQQVVDAEVGRLLFREADIGPDEM